MKILLVNDNPVVNKLVTLSAQKTSDELEMVSSIDEISSKEYNLLVIDDTLYSQELFQSLQEQIRFDKSLYICSRDAELHEGFTQVLKKPFLPTDLVEIFALIGKESQETVVSDETPEEVLAQSDESEEISLDLDAEVVELEGLDDLDGMDELTELGDLDGLGDLDLEDEDENIPSVLDDEEARKVKELLDEADEDDTLAVSGSFEDEFGGIDENDALDDLEDDAIDLEDTLLETGDLVDGTESEDAVDLEEDLSFEDTLSEEETTPQEIDLEDNLSFDTISKEEEVLEEESEAPDNLDMLNTSTYEMDIEDDLEEDTVEDDFESEDGIDSSDEFSIDDTPLEEEPVDELENMELQIENAVEELSAEDLASEVDEETLLGIVSDDMSSFDGLTTRELKLAVGEDVTELEDVAEEVFDEALDEEPVSEEIAVEEESTQDISENSGVEALKNLLNALSDKNVAASMKGMKININITLGEDT